MDPVTLPALVSMRLAVTPTKVPGTMEIFVTALGGETLLHIGETTRTGNCRRGTF